MTSHPESGAGGNKRIRRFAIRRNEKTDLLYEDLRTKLCGRRFAMRRSADEALWTKICGRIFADQDLQTTICGRDEDLRYEEMRDEELWTKNSDTKKRGTKICHGIVNICRFA